MKRIIIASVVMAWITISGMLWNVLNEQNFTIQIKHSSAEQKPAQNGLRVAESFR
jgi:hypothetical protein